MTRIGRLGGNASRPLAIVLTLMVGFTLSYGPLGPDSVVALGAGSGSTAGSSTEPGPASTAPGALLGQAAPSDSPSPSDSPTPAPTDTASPSPSDSPTPAPTDTAAPSPSDSPTPAPTDTAAPSPSPSHSPSPSAAPLPGGVVDEMGGTVVLGHVTVDVPPGAVSMKTRFFLGSGLGPDYAGIAAVEVFSLHTKQLDTGGETETFGVPVRLAVDTSALDLSDLDLGSLRIARLGSDGAWDVLPTHQSTDALAADTDRIGTFGVVARSAVSAIDLTLISDAPAGGRHRVDPGATVTVTVHAVPEGPSSEGTLYASAPLDWTLTDADGGTVDAATGEIRWPLSALDAGQVVGHSIVLQAPLIAADAASPQTTGTFGARVVRRRAPLATADTASILVAPKVMVEHRILGVVDPRSRAPSYGSEDDSLAAARKFQVLRIRFRVENPDSVPVAIAPLLQYRDMAPVVLPGLPGARGPATAGGWVTLPGEDASHGVLRFYAASEAADYAVTTAPIGASDTRTRGVAGYAGPGLAAAAAAHFDPGIRTSGLNPPADVTIPADGWTEIEFSVRATVWADWSASYDMRLTDGSMPIEPSVAATVAMESNPEPGVSPGLQAGAGAAGVDPWALYGSAGVSYALSAAGASGSGTLKAAGVRAAAAHDVVHADMSLTTDSCAICHLTHTAPNAYLANAGAGAQAQGVQAQGVQAQRVLTAAAAVEPQVSASALCLACHNGTGGRLIAAPQPGDAVWNDPATASYYLHDAMAPDGANTDPHAEGFKGILDRHSVCTDCHNPHSQTLVTSDPSSQTASGWTVPGAEGGASGVKVTNGAADTAPAYGWLDTPATKVGEITYEYELCLKCHSSYTVLPNRNPEHPSWAALDAGREFNPANISYHPVEAKGTNQSAYIDCSLSGTCAGVAETDRTYRLWSTFTSQSTVRCTQCHGSLPTDAVPGSTPDPGGDLQAHVSPNRGLLLQAYRDRTLKTFMDDTLTAPDLKDFALCFSCHSTGPFMSTGPATAVTGNRRADTAFGFHGNHIAALATGTHPGTCADTDIDHATGVNAGGTPCVGSSGAALGAGSGNAICSECHFRTHSTTFKVGDQGTYTGLVNFAPDVTGVDRAPLGLKAWVKDASDPQGGSCTLTCHGKVHIDVKY